MAIFLPARRSVAEYAERSWRMGLPGDIDLVVALVRGERVLDPGPLPLGEVLDAQAQDVADAVQRVARAAAGTARELGVSRPTVIKWRDRFAEHGIGGLDDEPRPGRSKTIDDSAIITATLAPPPESLGVTDWSSRLLDQHLGFGDATWRGRGASTGSSPGAGRRSSSPPTPMLLPVSWTSLTAPSRNSGSNLRLFSGMTLLIVDASSVRGSLSLLSLSWRPRRPRSWSAPATRLARAAAISGSGVRSASTALTVEYGFRIEGLLPGSVRLPVRTVNRPDLHPGHTSGTPPSSPPRSTPRPTRK